MDRENAGAIQLDDDEDMMDETMMDDDRVVVDLT
jgi:hypothetical protein